MLVSQPSQGQTVGDPLPVGGSLIYHALLYNRINGSSTRGLGLRFAGRLSLKVADRTYAGFGGGSWARVSVSDCGPSGCDGLITAQSEAFVYHLYVQQYLTGRVFIRSGAGVAETRTLIPINGEFISVSDRWRGVLSAGGGIDVPIARHVYLTPSLDFTALPGADGSARELSSALALGIAITLH